MDLISYNKDFVLKSNGFVNVGNTCYFNSLLQCLISCPSIFEVLEKNKDLPHYKENPIAKQMIKLYALSKSGEDIQNQCIPIWSTIIRASSRRSDRVTLRSGNQEDAQVRQCNNRH